MALLQRILPSIFFSAPLRGAIAKWRILPSAIAKWRIAPSASGSVARSADPPERFRHLADPQNALSADGRFAAAPDDSRGVLRLESLRIEFWTRLRSRFAEPTLELPRLASARRVDFPMAAKRPSRKYPWTVH